MAKLIEPVTVHINLSVPKIASLISTPKADQIEYGEKLTIECIVSDTDAEVRKKCRNEMGNLLNLFLLDTLVERWRKH